MKIPNENTDASVRLIQFYSKMIEKLKAAAKEAEHINFADILGFKRAEDYTELIATMALLEEYELFKRFFDSNDKFSNESLTATELLNCHVSAHFAPLEPTPLYFIATKKVREQMKDPYKMLRFLASYGADPNIAANFGYVALWDATDLKNQTWDTVNFDDNFKMLQTLLEIGADPNQSLDSEDEYVPLAYCLQPTYYEEGELEMLQGTFEEHDFGNYRPVNNQAIEKAKLLLKHGADPNLANPYIPDEPPLMAAIKYGKTENIELIALLLKHGADPNFTDSEGNTPLTFATKEGLTDVEELLYNYGADDFEAPHVDFEFRANAEYPDNDVKEHAERTYEWWLEKVQEKGWELKKAPKEFKTPELCLAAVQQYGGAIKYVPKKLITPELCLIAVQEEGWALGEVPEKFRTKEVCLAAVRQNGNAIHHVPKKLRTTEMYIVAMERYGCALNYIPKKHRNAEICLAAVKQNGFALKDVPEKHITAELCLAAVKSNGCALEHISEKLITAEICLAALQSRNDVEWLLNYMPEKFKTAELCLVAVQQTGEALRFIPDELKTEEICLAAIRQKPKTFEYVPDEIKTKEMCLEAVNEIGKALRFVPDELKTMEICLAAVQQNGKALEFVPKKFKTEELCLEAVLQNGMALEFVPEKFKTEELYLAAFRQTRKALRFIPERYRTHESYPPPVEPYDDSTAKHLEDYEREFKELNLSTVEDLENLLKSIIKDATKIVVQKPSAMPENSHLLSHCGGQPYFEKGEKWPKSEDGNYLELVFQIYNDGAIALPKNIKLLQFYYSWEECPWDTKSDGWLVKIYEDVNPDNFEFIEKPKELDRINYCEMKLKPVKSLPDYDNIGQYSFNAMLLLEELAKAHDGKDEWDIYYNAVEKLIGDTDFNSQLGGYPRWIQSGSVPEGYSLLFQIDTEDDAGIRWSDEGMAYAFYNGEKDEIEFDVQCH